MYDRVDKGKQPMHPNQSLWMSRLSALQQHNQLYPLLDENGTNQWHLQKGKEITSYISGSAEQRPEVKAIDFGILNGHQAMSSRNESNNRFESLDSSIINVSQNGQRTLNTERVPPLLSLAPPGTDTSYIDSHIQHKSVSQCPLEPVRSQMVLGSSLDFSESFPENLSGTTSHVSPQIYDLGEGRHENGSNPTAPSFVYSIEENVNHVRSMLSSKRKFSDTNIMEVPELEKCSNHCGPGFVSDDLRMRSNHPPAFCEEWYKRMHNSSGINLFPTYSHDANTMMIYTSAEDLGKCTPRFQEIRTFLVTENTDSYLRKENRKFKDPRVLSRGQENAPIKCYSFPQLFGHGKQGVQLQQLSSSDTEGKDNVHDVNATEVVSKNKSSAETHTIYRKKIEDKHLLGVESWSSKKDIKANTCLDHAIVTSGEVQPRKRPIPEIPDMNIELPAELDEASVVDNVEASTSRTRSLDIDCEQDTSSRWIKRLKISDLCNHSIGTKSLSLDEASSDKKANRLISNGVRDDDLEGRDGTKQLCSWIQRWQKNPATTHRKQPEPVVVCDPQSSKVSLEELQRKPFASIAAMALLGKGWSGLKCQYRNIGPLTLWDSKDM
ncbi:uncharacterized protein LOC141667318 isoform X2 [Apium graveolens]|uniref:uncharacterized protein LOC141667318 isoform X2 n=1 Tax=Apium graveolens TaxID=4045 RepID=UPI003D7AF5E4